jgi:hypothetical protein
MTDRPTAQEETMISHTCPHHAVFSWLRIVVRAAPIVALVACALSTPAQAGMWPRPGSGSDRTITITPVPRFDQSEVDALVEKPNVTFTVDKARIAKGKSAKLTWRVENADSVTISGLSGSVGRSGSRSVSPTAKTTYTLTARNRNGTVTKALTVDVTQLAAVIGTAHVIHPVVPAGTTVFDFIAKANTAVWQSSQRLSFGGSGGTKGWARKIASVRAEDNKDYKNVLQMMPEHRPNGIVLGEYSVKIPANGRFAATVGFTHGHGSPDGASVSVQVRTPAVRRRKAFWQTVATKTITRDGKLDTLTADLKAHANKTVAIRLVVNALRNYQDDMVIWIAPRILK